MKKLKDCCKFTFIDGDIVVSKNKVKFFDKVQIVNSNIISIEPSQLGPMVQIYNNKGINSIHTIPNTKKFMKSDPYGLCSKYLSLISNYLK